MMDHQKKLDFILKMTKHGLDAVQHFDAGGTALAGPATAGGGANTSSLNSLVGGVPVVGAIAGLGQNGFQAQGAPLQAGTNAAQLNQAYSTAQGGIGQQQNFANQLGAQGTEGMNAQNQLGSQLQQQALGGGPNPAQAGLNMNTGQNIAQTAALMAGQRGAGANAGLLASQAGAQGAATQQGAVGQGAALQAQQTLAAQQQLQNLAGTQIGQQGQAISGLNTAGQNEQGILQGANTSLNNANVAMQSNLNNVNSQTAQQNAGFNNKMLSGLTGAAGTALGSIGNLGSSFGFAQGGTVPELPKHLHAMASLYHPHYASGGDVGFSGGNYAAQPAEPAAQAASPAPAPAAASSDDSSGGAAASLAPLAMAAMAKGGNVGSAMKSGGKVPGKPMVGHDAYSNDTVDAKLTPGETVIDLDTLKRKDALGKAARFVAANIARKNAGRKL